MIISVNRTFTSRKIGLWWINQRRIKIALLKLLYVQIVDEEVVTGNFKWWWSLALWPINGWGCICCKRGCRILCNCIKNIIIRHGKIVSVVIVNHCLYCKKKLFKNNGPCWIPLNTLTKFLCPSFGIFFFKGIWSIANNGWN